MNTIKDCRLIKGDKAAIISRDTCIAALEAMEEKLKNGDYTKMFADDQSFIRVNFNELRVAVEEED